MSAAGINFGLFDIFLSKIIKNGGNLMKICQKQVCTVFETRSVFIVITRAPNKTYLLSHNHHRHNSLPHNGHTVGLAGAADVSAVAADASNDSAGGVTSLIQLSHCHRHHIEEKTPARPVPEIRKSIIEIYSTG